MFRFNLSKMQADQDIAGYGPIPPFLLDADGAECVLASDPSVNGVAKFFAEMSPDPEEVLVLKHPTRGRQYIVHQDWVDTIDNEVSK